jgi:glycosyltransferase involved in cell wall biosynthesis
VRVITCAPNFPGGKVFPGFENAWYQHDDMDGIEVVRVKTFVARNQGVLLRALDFSSFMVSGFVAGLIEEKPDVIVATSPQFLAAVGGWGVATCRGTPFVFELSDLWPASIRAVGALRTELLLRAVEKVELFLYRQSSMVVALTESFKRDLLRRGIPDDHVKVVKNGVDLPRFSPSRRDAVLAREWGVADKIVVGYIGTHGMAHALGNVLDAALLLRDRSNLRFLLVGDGAEREALLERRTAEGIDNVVMVPRQPKEAIASFWSLCDVALVHLKNDAVFAEVIPSKIFEAMAMGLPIILAAPPGEASQIITESGAGICVPAQNPEALAQAVARLTDDPARRSALANISRESAFRYSRERQAREMERVLLEVVGSASRNGGEACVSL